MELELLTLSLAALAGVLTMLNPCVLPLLPVVASAAMARSTAGLIALAMGMSFAFTAGGTLLASTGRTLVPDGDAIRFFAAALMLAIGILLVSIRAQAGFSYATAGIADRAQRAMSRIQPGNVGGQFGVGTLLGLVWTPCVGPTLGAAVLLAHQGERLAEVGVVMAVFSLAAVTPLVLIGLGSRSWFMRNRDKAMRYGAAGRRLLGYGLLAIGLLVLTGGDKWLETWVLDHAPAWLIDLTTRY